MKSAFGLQCFVMLLCLALRPATSVDAHKVTVFAWVEGHQIFGEAKFSGGRVAQNAPIVVRDEQGKELLQTRTDEQGQFSFDVPQATGLVIELLAGMGHRAIWTLSRQEVSGHPPPDHHHPPDTTTDAAVSKTAPLAAVSAAEMEQVVERVLDRKLAPLIQKWGHRPDTSPAMTDIIGGIGYIFGLMGLFFYFKSRRADKDTKR